MAPERTAHARAVPAPLKLASGDRLSLSIQEWCAALAGPLTISAIVFFMRCIVGWRIRDHRAVRRQLRAAISSRRGPLLLVANHLSYYDSLLIAWAIAPLWRLLLQPSLLPWNVPERKNFAASGTARTLAYLCKCLPVERGGDRDRTAVVLGKLEELLRRGRTVLIFPEGRRSRSGRVDHGEAAHGVGRLVKSMPGARVLCIYLRGDLQREASVLPAARETFELSFSWLAPHTEKRGLRGSMELTHQILDRLSEMEAAYFDGRQ